MVVVEITIIMITIVLPLLPQMTWRVESLQATWSYPNSTFCSILGQTLELSA